MTSSNLPKGRSPDTDEADYFECSYCCDFAHMDQMVTSEDGQFCSEDCRSEFEQERAIARAEAMAEAYS